MKGRRLTWVERREWKRSMGDRSTRDDTSRHGWKIDSEIDRREKSTSRQHQAECEVRPRGRSVRLRMDAEGLKEGIGFVPMDGMGW